MSILLKTLLSLGIKLLTEKYLEELIIWILTKLAKSTKTKVDDELVEITKKHLKKRNQKGENSGRETENQP